MTNAFSRRQFLLGGLVLAGTGAVTACTSDPGPAASAPGSSLRPTPTPTALGEPTVRRTLTARPLSLDIGGIEAKTWGYVSDTGDAAIEATAGDVLQVDITNELPESTSIHWHGIALHNAADGVPGMTQDPIEPGESFSYVFEVPHGGTYFYHSHTGLQLDRSLHAPLIIRDPQDAEDQDVEWTIVLDDWVDGIQGTPAAEPDKLIEQLKADAAVMSADTLFNTIPTGMGVDVNVKILDNFATHLAPALGWQPNHKSPVTGYPID